MLRSVGYGATILVAFFRPAECVYIPGTEIDPLKLGEQLLMMTVASIVLIFLWVFRRRVIFVLTGDDRIHISFQDVVWFTCCKCVGMCDGQWTRFVTRHCADCCCANDPKHAQWYNVNLKRMVARYFGILPKQLEIRNVVAGDLPYFGIQGDFYVTFECGENPPKTSSIKPSSPRVIHWPEVFRMRVRDSIWEAPINISVKELNVFGHNEIANCSLTATKVFRKFIGSKNSDVGQMLRMRFQLEPHRDNEAQHHTMTPAWIMLEFGLAQENTYGQKAKYSILGQETTTFASVTKTVSSKDALRSKEFKEKDPLYDKRGRKIPEPPDISDAVHQADRWRRRQRCCVCLVIFLFMFSASGFRLYLSQCWQEYEAIHVALLQNTSLNYTDLPLSLEVKDRLWKKQKLDRAEGKHDIYRPTEDEVVATCEESPYHPRVLERYSREMKTMGVFGRIKIQCTDWSCQGLLEVRESKAFMWILGILIVSLVCCRIFGSQVEMAAADEFQELKLNSVTYSPVAAQAAAEHIAKGP